MQLPVVVGVDGSQGSLRALDWAAAEAARSGLPLRLVHASLWERYESSAAAGDSEHPTEQVLAEQLVTEAQERAQRLHPELTVEPSVEPEDPVAALVAASHEAAMVVLGSRGRGRIAGMLLGSVSLSLANRSHCPAVVVPAAEPGTPPGSGRVVVGIGSAPGPSAAAVFALEQAASRHGELVAVRAWRSPTHGAMAMSHPLLTGSATSAHHHEAEEHLEEVLETLDRSESPEVTIHKSVVQGPAHQRLLEAAAGADLLVVGTRRDSERRGLHLGPVNHAMLHYAPCPVAVVPDVYLASRA